MAAYPSLDVVLRVVEAIATVAACILVIWYAWETREIRKATKEQSGVMRRQLEMLQQKEQPWFTCNQTEKSDSMVKLHLLNSGGRALPGSLLQGEFTGSMQSPSRCKEFCCTWPEA